MIEPSPRIELMQVVEDLAPKLAAKSVFIEQARHLPQEIADELAARGLYRMLTPRSFGGHEVDIMTFASVIERLARADASAAWCTFISCTSALVGAYLPMDEAARLFADPAVKLAGVYAPGGRATRTERNGVPGFLVSGHWNWGSGSRNANYIVGGCFIIDDDGKPELTPAGKPNVQSMVFSAEQVTIADTWHSVGLCGTGSNAFSVEGVFVPTSRTASLVVDTPLPRPLYRFPVFGVLGLSIAAVALGIAHRAIESLIDLSKQKTPQGSARPLAERSGTQLAIACCSARLRAARAFLHEVLEDTWAVSKGSDPIAVSHRRDIRLAATFATTESAAVVDRMHRLAGGSAVYQTSPIQRCLRDVHVATQHIMVSESTYELAGRLLLDLPTDISTL
ncbi:flavin-dependent monooxygenase [Ralstonia pseudosolanacearum]|uniref:flavin-dependent monooxygenase n=1 Tax=Ralstonia pseudosolanacearum TaxID=1310165 RepID=UPI0020068503|nr:flavin-dependent monooxygenase [Ralstonia pseudosolanacearum]MCK4124501.1 flavin-dependent monooxygenase [Ralstonia pseudosolanacearum]